MIALKNTKLLLLSLLILAVALAAYSFWDILMPFFIAAILAYVLGPIARWLTRKTKLKHGFSVAVVLFVFLAIVVTIISFSLPYAITQVSSLVRDISAYASNFDQVIAVVTEKMEGLHLPPIVLEPLETLLSKGDTYLAELFNYILTGLVNLSMGVFDLVIVIIVTVYFMLDGQKLMDSFKNILPDKIRIRFDRITATANDLTWKYIRSRVILSAGMAIVTYIGLTIMGVKYALLFAALSFVLDFIPYFGSIIAGVIEAVYALVTSGLGLGIAVGLFVLVVQQIEGNIVAPKIQGDVTGIHPVTVMFALLACNRLWGPVGMLISTPVAVIVKTVVVEIYDYIISPDDHGSSQKPFSPME